VTPISYSLVSLCASCTTWLFGLLMSRVSPTPTSKVVFWLGVEKRADVDRALEV